MSGLAEWFQKPHFQQADATICLWHKKKGKIEAPKERLGTKPFIPPTACQRGRGRASTGRSRDWALQTPPLREGRRAAGTHPGGVAHISPCATVTGKTGFSTEERRHGRDGLPTEKIWNQRKCWCRLPSMTKGKSALVWPRRRASCPESRWYPICGLTSGGPLSPSCLGCHITTADFFFFFFPEHLLNATHWHFSYPETEAQRGRRGTTGRWQTQAWNPGSLAPEAVVLTTTPGREW